VVASVIGRFQRVVGTGAALALAVTCGGTFPPAPADYSVHVENNTTLNVAMIVNDRAIGFIGSGEAVTFGVEMLPPLPWDIEVRSPSGRVLLNLPVQIGDVEPPVTENGGTSMSGSVARVDLSCGRLDLWVGAPMIGPPPDGGVPGDCEP
jgi:hypothetical protein